MEPQTKIVTPMLTLLFTGIGPYAASDMTLSSRGGAICLLGVGWLSLRENRGIHLIGKSICLHEPAVWS